MPVLSEQVGELTACGLHQRAPIVGSPALEQLVHDVPLLVVTPLLVTSLVIDAVLLVAAVLRPAGGVIFPLAVVYPIPLGIRLFLLGGISPRG